ncbi:hypothetical protein BEP19_15010 [Ammoniphilus oxalaticus]|uniref:HTH cro/C1-type domain-containing protein n=1 Tax=Ammoniphilus oxalaticus TaxID=66863 RepID=A0A419SD37_9BACL|nr:helix-turn-helix transcriptional regulator [Ammoniphilus oxalaticus]RKD20991.1 hypothetical protein BEP19_15010 [Ammoniphilus oxalaticus]
MMYGPLLKEARLKAGLSQEEMAEKLHLSRSNVSRLENNYLALKVRDLVDWFQVTGAPEIAAAIICGVDVAAVMQIISTVSTMVVWALTT